jgi:hypothetical protein
VIDVIFVPRNGKLPIRVTLSVAANEGKKTDEGTTMAPAECGSNSVAVADLPETQSLTPATTKEASDIQIKLQIWVVLR